MASAKEKKEIYKLWGKAFPNLATFSPTAFYITLDIAVVGIKLMPLIGGEEYRPYFMCFPLWKENNETNMDKLIFMQELRDAKNMQLDISYLASPDTINKAINATHKQVGACIQEHVHVKDIFGILNKQFAYLPVQRNPILQSLLLEYELMIALYINNPNFINEVKEVIIKVSKDWNPEFFEPQCGKIEDWRKQLFDRLDNRDSILKLIQENLNEGKIAKLPRSHMVY